MEKLIKQYLLTIETRNGNKNFEIEATDEKDALIKLLDKCDKEDDTGVFFELENANLDVLKENQNFRTFSTEYGEYGVILKDVKILNS